MGEELSDDDKIASKLVQDTIAIVTGKINPQSKLEFIRHWCLCPVSMYKRHRPSSCSLIYYKVNMLRYCLIYIVDKNYLKLH